MWARRTDWNWKPVGKYHWFEPSRRINETSLLLAECGRELRMYLGEFNRTKRQQPRHADRCKRCVAALERRKDENADE